MPRNSRALLFAEIRTCGKPGSATADALMGFSPARNLNRWSEAEPVTRPLSFHAAKDRTRRARAFHGNPGFPNPDEFRFRRTEARWTRLRRVGSSADRVPKNLIRPRLGIHQDLSSGSPDNSDVLIGNPIRK